MELYEVQRLVQRVSDLESRVEALEEAQINPYNIVSFTAVAVAGQMNLKPIQMGVSGFLCLGRLFHGQPNEAALCI